MATIGSISVSITATTEKFHKGIQSAQAKLTGFVKGITKATAIAGGFAAYGLASVVKQTVALGDALGDTAAKLNINVESLQALNYAVKQLGSSETALHSALARLDKLLGSAAAGSDTADAAFARLGLSADELVKMPLEQRFLAVVDAINKLPNSTQQADAAQTIFGKGAKDLMGVIRSGSDAIRGMGDELAKLHGILSGDAVDALGEAQNSLQSFTAQWEALKLKMVSEFAPEIENGTWGIIHVMDFLAGTIKGIGVVSTVIFEGIAQAIRGAAEAINVLLPKSLELNTAPLEQFIGSLRQRRKELLQEIQSWDAPQNNPLNNTNPQSQKQIEQNTKTTNQKLDEQIRLMRQQQGQPRVVLNTGMVG